MSDEGSGKWTKVVVGIVATVVAGLLLALLKPVVAPESSPSPLQESPALKPVVAPESSRSPLQESPAPREVEVRILNLPRVTLASVSEKTALQLRVFNGGNLAAESCQVQVSDEAGVALTNSEFFGLTPGATENVDLTVGPFDQSLFTDAIRVRALVECRNGRSEVYTTVMSILR